MTSDKNYRLTPPLSIFLRHQKVRKKSEKILGSRQSAALRAGGHRLFAKRDISLTVHTSECLLSLQLRLLQSVSLTSLRKTVSR